MSQKYDIKKAQLDIPRLAAEIYYCSEVAEAVEKSNQGGLQVHDFWQFVRKDDELNNLREMLLVEIANQLGKVPNDIQMWLNINPSGCYNAFHNHDTPDVDTYSGVFYVVVPADSGELVFKDGNDIDKFMPEDNMLVTFPSNLWHAVNPNNSFYDRISVAFNFAFS